MRHSWKILNCLVLLAAVKATPTCQAQDSSVSVNVVVERAATANSKKTRASRVSDASNVAVWLSAIDRTAINALEHPALNKAPQLVQRRKTFEPHILIVPIGTKVEFPNRDPFFHNIFSLYDGRRFDLGLYEAGTTRSVLFDRPGVSFLFCNIHAEMSAVVVSLDTPYFGLSDPSGNIVIRNVPNGRYQLNVWFERADPEYLKGMARTVTISDATRNLGPIRLQENPNFTPAHKNKYGLDYVPPPNPEYDHP